MPEIHRFFKTMTHLLDQEFLGKFPEWIMGPMSVAVQLRGFDAFLLMLSPKSIEKLLRNIVDARKLWQTEQGKYLNRNRTRRVLGNDDVNAPTISPNHDHQYLLPLEQELCDYYGGIFYWHSCVNTTNLLRSIGLIQKLDLFQCGPWTDIASACETFRGKQTALEIMVEPIEKHPDDLDQVKQWVKVARGVIG